MSQPPTLPGCAPLGTGGRPGVKPISGRREKRAAPCWWTSSQEDTFLAQRLLRARATRSSRCADTWDTRAEVRHEVYAEPPRGDHEEDLAV